MTEISRKISAYLLYYISAYVLSATKLKKCHLSFTQSSKFFICNHFCALPATCDNSNETTRCHNNNFHHLMSVSRQAKLPPSLQFPYSTMRHLQKTPKTL